MADPARLEELAWCDACHGPVVPKTKLAMCWEYLCFVLAMWWPNRFFMSRPHAAILPHAGGHAYTCTCWPKIAALRSLAQQEGESR